MVISHCGTVRGVAKSSDYAIDVLQKCRCPQKGQGYKVCKQFSSYNDKLPVHKPLRKFHSKVPNNYNCSHCGQSPMHPRQQCPARDATCHHCSKKGHFKSVCQSKAVHDISVNNSDRDPPIMLTILPIMLCCTAQKFTYYAQIYAQYLPIIRHSRPIFKFWKNGLFTCSIDRVLVADLINI